jgi:hypothetical protein
MCSARRTPTSFHDRLMKNAHLRTEEGLRYE